jgi:cyclopropane-fatty-acyl-phospholipid synthase
MERADLEILDVESLRLHYARTTRQWTERLQANAARARALVGERTYRAWLAYLAASSVAFASGSSSLYQTIAVRPAAGAAGAPTTREEIYAPRARTLARAS